MLNDVTGALRVGRKILANANGTPTCTGGGRHRLQTKDEEAAERAAGRAGVHEGRQETVRGALLHMFHSLHKVHGGVEAAEDFLAVLHGLKEDGLLVDDDTLYDDPTLRPPAARNAAIPQSVAAAGLGPAGRVSVRPLFCRCLPTGLRAVASARRVLRARPQPRKASSCTACLSPSTARRTR